MVQKINQQLKHKLIQSKRNSFRLAFLLVVLALWRIGVICHIIGEREFFWLFSVFLLHDWHSFIRDSARWSYRRGGTKERSGAKIKKFETDRAVTHAESVMSQIMLQIICHIRFVNIECNRDICKKTWFRISNCIWKSSPKLQHDRTLFSVFLLTNINHTYFTKQHSTYI